MADAKRPSPKIYPLTPATNSVQIALTVTFLPSGPLRYYMGLLCMHAHTCKNTLFYSFISIPKLSECLPTDFCIYT